MRWTDVREIAIALAEAHPDVAPLSVRFTDLHRWVRELPGFASRLHFRILDVTALKLEWTHRGGKAFEKETPDQIRAAFPAADLEGDARHDAYYDAQASIAELAHYRHHWRLR